MRLYLLIASVAALAPVAPQAAAQTATVRLAYDPQVSALVDSVSGAHAKVDGAFTVAQTPLGPAVRLDGNTGAISISAVPRLTDGTSWSVSAWLKLDALPWNEAPILDQATPAGNLFFGLDAYGHLVAQRQAGSAQAQRIVSAETVPPRTWTLVTVSFEHGVQRLWMNGRPIASAQATAVPPVPGSSDTPLLIGRARAPALPYPSNAVHPLLPIRFGIEGTIARLTLLDTAMTMGQARTMLAQVAPAMRMPEAAPTLPRWTGGPGPFGAFHASLRYDPAWDGPRRVADGSDVVVRFADAPVQLVFWQGANYIPAWVTENGRWYSDQFMEIYGKPRCPDGEDCEPMSDKQVRYSHVEVLESTPARAVVHWRYALSEVENERLADAADPHAWGAWADEYWTVYPDAAAVRKQVLWTDHPDREASEFQESIVMIPAGETPEDNINFDALTLANLKGETKSYQWLKRSATDFAKPRGPDHFTGLADPMIQWINLKSQWKPFEIAGGGPATFEGINWEPSMASFEWWNHWPVAQIRSSGRPALTSDRPSHSSLSHIAWPIAEKDDKRLTRLLLTGLTPGTAGALAPRARSWLTPPAASVSDAGTARYDASQRAYLIQPGRADGPVRIEITASEAQPLVNPAFVVEGWQGSASVAVQGPAGPVVTPDVGYVETLAGRRLVVFSRLEARGPVVVTLKRQP